MDCIVEDNEGRVSGPEYAVRGNGNIGHNPTDSKTQNNFSSYLGARIGKVLEFIRQVYLMEVGKDIERLFDKLDMYEK